MHRRSLPGWSTRAIARIASVVVLAFVLGSPSATIADEGPRWPWPVAPPIVVGRGFVAPATPYSAGHRGIDLTVDPGTEVHSPADGVVTFAGVVVDRPVLTIDVGGDVLVSFEPLEAAVARGDLVARGELVGHLAAGGHCGSSCLHVGVRVRGAYVSPMLFFDRVPRAVLLPLE